MDDAKIYIIVGGSGSGKTTLVENLLKSDLGLTRVLTHTTRKPRSTEVDKQDYVFISVAEFLKLVAVDYFIEYSNAYGNWYGTSKMAFSSTGKSKIIILDAEGAINIKKNYPNSHVIYIPTEKEVLQKRLSLRGDTEDLVQRIALMDQELQKISNIDKYTVKNKEFAEIFEEVYKYIKKSKKNVDII